jgi:hypothetical protein
VFGVGPFFVLRRFRLVDLLYRGQPSNAELSVALAQSGGIQLELIEQHDREPSAFVDAGEGLHHVAYWTRELDRDLAACEARGIEIVQSGRSASGGANERFVYFSPRDDPATIVELTEVLGWKESWLTLVAEAAEGWDGSDPVRPAPPLRRA